MFKSQIESACDSPIEEKFLAAWSRLRAGWGFEHIRHDRKTARAIFRFDNGLLVEQIATQYRVGPYKVDFWIEQDAGERKKAIVVECDGFAFHDATKEQAARDKARDRFLTIAGLNVLRFAGTEIHSNPDKCVGEAAVFLERCTLGVVA